MCQALAGKNVKDMLLNVGSGGGAAAAAPTGGATGGTTTTTDAPAEKEEEKKEEGKIAHMFAVSTPRREILTYLLQRRKSRTRTWASVYSTRHALRFYSSSDLVRIWKEHQQHLLFLRIGLFPFAMLTSGSKHVDQLSFPYLVCLKSPNDYPLHASAKDNTIPHYPGS